MVVLIPVPPRVAVLRISREVFRGNVHVMLGQLQFQRVFFFIFLRASAMAEESGTPRSKTGGTVM